MSHEAAFPSRDEIIPHEDVAIDAADGFRLAGVCFDAGGSSPRAVAIVNSGAGIPSTHYAKFASYLAAAGIPTVTYDYRGIGRSSPRSLRGFEVSVEEWGSKDCAAAVSWMRSRYPGASTIVVGHSIGCFLLGFMRSPELVDSAVFVGAHTGYYRDYARSLRLPMWLAWHCAMPAVTRLTGYFPGRRLGLPADLPKTVAYEWARRRRPDFWWNLRDSAGRLDTLRAAELRARFARFACDSLMMVVSDDAFATQAGASRIAALFSGMRFTWRRVDASATRAGAVGHFGFFRGRSRLLWPTLSDWIDSSAPAPPVKPTHAP
jgi:predicted alpha/beta hydrolase